jgi:hypothetical protein
MKPIEEIKEEKEIHYLTLDKLKDTLCSHLDDSMERMGKEKSTGIMKTENGKFLFCIEDVFITRKGRDGKEVLSYYCEIDSSLQEEPEVLN